MEIAAFFVVQGVAYERVELNPLAAALVEPRNLVGL